MDTEQIQDILSSEKVLNLSLLSDLGRKVLRTVFESTATKRLQIDLQQLWLRLQWTACDSTVVDKHLTAACNAICVFIRCACCNINDEVRSLGFSEQIWRQTLEVVRKAFGDGNHKPALQTLDTLIYTLHENENQDQSKTRLRSVIIEMMDVIFTGQPATRLKEACICISLFVKRTSDIIPVPQFFDGAQVRLRILLNRRYRPTQLDDQQIYRLPEEPLGQLMLALLITSSSREVRTAAMKLFSLLCSKTEKIDLSENVAIASAVIESYLQANSEALEDFSVNVFPAVLNDRDQFNKFMKRFNPDTDFSTSRLSICLAIVQVGCQKGFMAEQELATFLTDIFDIVPHKIIGDEAYTAFRNIFKCNAGDIRLQALQLLTSSGAMNAPVPQRALMCIEDCFRYLQDDTDPWYRDGYVAICRRLLLRMDRSEKAFQRANDIATTSSRDIQADYNTSFLSWNSYLQAELSPQASYQRHILALHILHYTIPLSMSSRDRRLTPRLLEDIVLALLALIFDAFDDVRSQAAALLVVIGSHNDSIVTSVLQNFDLIILGQELSANTKRADHADALGRLLMLDSHVGDLKAYTGTRQCGIQGYEYIKAVTNRLNEHVARIHNLSPSSDFPLHGTLLGIANILHLLAPTSAMLDSGIMTAVLHACSDVWSLVQKDLCIDSPETEADEDEQFGSEGPKDLLAYSWRALRDSSLVLQALLQTQPASLDLYQTIGGLCLDQLVKLRHRGAFSTVAQTFYLCCEKSRNADEATGRNLSDAWLQVALREIDNQSKKLTRRSAGIPSMFTALLDPGNSTQFLYGIRTLTEIAQKTTESKRGINFDDQRLPQVHALNSLKDVMTNSRFRVVTEPLVVEMLNLAAQCLSSIIWAIRNCGLMLFRACVNRLTPESSVLYGTHAKSNDIGLTGTPLAVATSLLRNQHHDYEIIPAITRAELENRYCEIVFAALELLGKIPSRPEYDQIIEEAARAQFASKIWAVRDHAACLVASKANMEGITLMLARFQKRATSISFNEAHGELLCIRYILHNQWQELEHKRKRTTAHEMIVIFQDPDMIALQLWKQPTLLGAILDILNDILAFALAEETDTHEIVRCLQLYSKISAIHGGRTVSFMLRRATSLSLALVYICADVSKDVENYEKDSRSRDIPDLMRESDVTIYTVNELVQKASSSHAGAILEFLSDLGLTGQPTDVQAAILQGMSDCMSATQVTQVSPKLDKLIVQLNLLQVEDRDLWNAGIRAASSFLQLKLELGLNPPHDLVKGLGQALQLSQQDAVEMPTRLSAAEAIVRIAPILLSTNTASNSFDASISLQLLLVLYDFLNDDDTEVREVAMTAASVIQNRAYNLPQLLVRCAIAAREALVDMMLSLYRTNGLLIGSACMRIIGISPAVEFSAVESIKTFCCKQPVLRLSEDAIKRAKDLFAEERQNLYLDDIQEIRVWAGVASQCRLDSLDIDAIATMMSWTNAGLQTLISTLEARPGVNGYHAEAFAVPQRHAIHPLGLTYSAEMLTIFVRVITLAILLKSPEYTIWTGYKEIFIQQQEIAIKLEILHKACQKHLVHPQVMLVFEQPSQG